jgi:hypothetical protein
MEILSIHMNRKFQKLLNYKENEKEMQFKILKEYDPCFFMPKMFKS